MVKRFVTGRVDTLITQYLRPAPLDPAIFMKPQGWTSRIGPTRAPADIADLFSAHLLRAIEAGRDYLLSCQNPDQGYWCGELLADTTIESDYVMLLHFLGRPEDPKIERLATFIESRQNEDGGWSIYRNGPSEISATVKAYWALKLARRTADDQALMRARACIQQLGGIHRVNTYSKFYMALFGLYDWKGVPSVPPEISLLPDWFYFNIYEMSSWTRAIVLPLALLWSARPQVSCPEYGRLDELFPDEARYLPLNRAVSPHGLLSWTRFFLSVDKGVKFAERIMPRSLRRWAVETTRREILTRFEGSDGLGAIFPAIVNTILALKALGYRDDDPIFLSQMRQLEAFELDRGAQGIEMQPCFSPVWDTAISIIALAEAGLDRGHPALRRAVDWLLAAEIRRKGDWAVKNPHGPVGGWPFEFRNDFYPDLDDTAMVLMALRQVFLEEKDALRREQAFQRGLNWILSMQSDNGGWAAFDKNNTQEILTKIPFADHNAMIDPPTSDITARMLEMLGAIGFDRSYPIVERGIEFVRSRQEQDGSWFGRWGVNYIYGTWQALRGLRSIGESMRAPYVQRAVHWLRSVQNPDGSFGERCSSYDDPALKAQGPSTPSQTAWGLMGLLTALPADDPAVEKAARWLVEHQNNDGSWNEEEFTGTGFPKVFYLEYTMYRNYFALMALGQYCKAWALSTDENASRN